MSLAASSLKKETAGPPPLVELTVIGTRTDISALPVTVNLALYMGDDFSLVITVKNPDGSTLDLTGYTATGMVKVRAGDPPPPLATLTCTTGGVAGTITVALANADSAALPIACVYDVQMRSGGGLITTLIAGTITMTQQVTIG